MKWLLAGMLLLMGACAQLPTIESIKANRLPEVEMNCRSHFPQGHWQLVHTIHARFYGGRQAAFTGVVVLLRNVLEGNFLPVLQYLPVVAAVTLGACLLAIRWAVDQFNSESVLFRESEQLNMGLWLRHLPSS